MCKTKTCIQRHSNAPNIPALAGESAKFWLPGQVLTASLLDATTEQENYAYQSAQAWMDACNIVFDFITRGDGQVRISFDDRGGAWSYVGRDLLNISTSRPTMNLGWISGGVGEHEFGHTLGMIHEHQNPNGGIQWNREAVIKDLSGPPNYWDIDTIEFNIFRKYSKDRINGTEVDPLSIMMYSIPTEWTLDDFETPWNTTLSPTDIDFVAEIYPEKEPEPPINLREILQDVFRDEKEAKKLCRLYERSLVRLGHALGLPTDEDLRKKENYRIIRDALLGE